MCWWVPQFWVGGSLYPALTIPPCPATQGLCLLTSRPNGVWTGHRTPLPHSPRPGHWTRTFARGEGSTVRRAREFCRDANPGFREDPETPVGQMARGAAATSGAFVAFPSPAGPGHPPGPLGWPRVDFWGRISGAPVVGGWRWGALHPPIPRVSRIAVIAATLDVGTGGGVVQWSCNRGLKESCSGRIP